MCARWFVAAALLLPVVLAGQERAVLRVTVSLADAAGRVTPVARHTLLISDNPASGPPKVVRTAADGTVELSLVPGTYAVESEQAIMFEGRAYEWFQYLDLEAGERVTLDLTTANAETPAPVSVDGSGGPRSDPTFLLGQWQRSVVAIWSPTARASGVVVDGAGLLATDGSAIGDATTVAVQLSPTLKVPALVLVADAAAGGVAILRVGANVTADRVPVPLECSPTEGPRVSAGDELLAIASEMGRPVDMTWGGVISPGPPRIATDFRMSAAGAGAPVFDSAGTLVGITSILRDRESPRSHEVEVVPTLHVCAALASGKAALADAPPPRTAALPVESERPFPAAALDAEKTRVGATAPPMLTSEDFEIAVVTPLAIHHGRLKAGWTGGPTTRAADMEARLGRVTDFGAWADYFAEAPAVVVVRATPKMVEGFWKRLGREAARTQGAALPAFRHFKTSFVRMTLACGATSIEPIHPFVLDHQVSEKDVIREGLYVFDPEAFDPVCADLRLTLQSERGDDTIPIPQGVVERVRQDFSLWRK